MEKLQLLKISEDRRFIINEDGTPFFWLGDTGWELFHRQSREGAVEYLKNRAELKFNVIQAVLLSEFDGLRVPNAYNRTPLLQNSKGEYDPAMPDLTTEAGDYTYWDHVDYVIDQAAELGLYIGLLPAWGDKYNLKWGKGPEIFNGENAYIYGKWLGERYGSKKNIIWVLGGDRQLDYPRHLEVTQGLAKGIKEKEAIPHLMTFHPEGATSSSSRVHNEDWLDFNMIQSGHDRQNNDNYKRVEDDYARKPVKPVLDAEPRYEDHPINFNSINGYFDDYDVRQAAYWAVFAGALGHTYGHHCIWGMTMETSDYYIMDWKTAMVRPGARQMKYLRQLIESRPFLRIRPDPELLVSNYGGANHMQAARGDDYAYIYSPCGLSFRVNMGRISGEKVKAYWYDPRNGETHYIDEYLNTGTATFVPPSSGRNNDWVLLLDDWKCTRNI